MVALTLYKMWLLRQAHGMCPKHVERPLRIVDETEGTPFEVTLKHHTKTQELLSARNVFMEMDTYVDSEIYMDGFMMSMTSPEEQFVENFSCTRKSKDKEKSMIHSLCW